MNQSVMGKTVLQMVTMERIERDEEGPEYTERQFCEKPVFSKNAS